MMSSDCARMPSIRSPRSSTLSIASFIVALMSSSPAWTRTSWSDPGAFHFSTARLTAAWSLGSASLNRSRMSARHP